MKTYLDCLPCFLNQALRTGRIATKDEKKIKRILDEVGMTIKDIPMESTPPETSIFIYRKIKEITGNIDPYKEIKIECTKKALSLYPLLKKKVEKADDSLLYAIRLAIAGNAIDYGVNKIFNIEQEIDETLKKKFAILDYEKFKYYKDSIGKNEKILYIADNAGESVFDRILIEEMKKQIIYVVRENPIINDVTYDDAIQAGIDKVATIISSGTSTPGTILNYCNEEFKKMFYDSKFIISKGQGNYEGLSNEKVPIFFLLKVKCSVLANHIGVKENDIVLKGINI